jgi:hypothetical protein
MQQRYPIGDEPTLNGHAILSAADVQVWFKKAGCIAPKARALSIAQLLNQYEFLGASWKNTSELRQLRRKNPSRLRQIRLATALHRLQSDLPPMIEDARNVLPAERHKELEPIIDFLDRVNEIAPQFEGYLPRRGRGAEIWHVVARKVGAKIIETFKASTGRRAGFGKPTSPAITVLQPALAYLGIDASPQAIVDAMRPRRMRQKQGK